MAFFGASTPDPANCYLVPIWARMPRYTLPASRQDLTERSTSAAIRAGDCRAMQFIGFGKGGGRDGFIIRIHPNGKLPPLGLRIGGSGDDVLSSIDLDSGGNIYAAGVNKFASLSSARYSAKQGRKTIESGFIVKIDGRQFAQGHDGVVWARLLGGNGDDALLSLSAGMPGFVFVSGRSGSTDFPTTKGALFRR